MTKALVLFGGDAPRFGERILILRTEWLEHILSERKALEIRGTRLREGDIWLGNNGIVYGKARLGKAKRIRTTKDWQELRHLHLVADDGLPYKKTWGLPLSSVIRLREAVPFVHRRGVIGIARFRPP